MTGRHRRSIRTDRTPRLAAGAFALGSMFAFPAVASADPAPPPGPVPGMTGAPGDVVYADPPPNLPSSQGLLSPLQQSAGPVEGPAGLPTPMPDMSQGAVNEFVLAQNAAPAAPGTNPDTQHAPNTNALNNSYILPRNVKPAAPGQGQLYDVEPGAENDDITNRQMWQHLWHGYQDGLYKGGFVNRGGKDTLNNPLPGTDPPKGTRIPGLADDSQGPAPDQWHWTPPEPPEGTPPPPGAPAPAAPAAPAPPAPGA